MPFKFNVFTNRFDYYATISSLGIDVAPVNLSSQCDGLNLVFTTPDNMLVVLWVSLNDINVVEGQAFTKTAANQITLTFPPDSGEELYIKYIKA